MRSTIYYRAFLKDPAKIDDIKLHFYRPDLNPLLVDFPYDPELLSLTAPRLSADLDSYVEQTYHDWARHCFLLYKRIPRHFKGIVLEVDRKAGSLGFVFGKFSDKEWRCHNYLPTYRDETGEAHKKTIGLLKELEPFVDQLLVEDTDELWKNDLNDPASNPKGKPI